MVMMALAWPELLHDLGVHALLGKHREVRVAQLMEAPAAEAEKLAVAVSPATEGIGMHALGVEVEHDKRVLGLLLPTLLELLMEITARVEVFLLGLLAPQKRLTGEVRHGQSSHTRARLGVLEIPEAIEVVVDGEHLLSKSMLRQKGAQILLRLRTMVTARG